MRSRLQHRFHVSHRLRRLWPAAATVAGWPLNLSKSFQCGQVLREELIELFRHAVQFRFKVSTYPSW
jgi:hypothetical protein